MYLATEYKTAEENTISGVATAHCTFVLCGTFYIVSKQFKTIFSIINYSAYYCLYFRLSIIWQKPDWLSIKCIYKALLTSADVTKCCTKTQPKTPNSKQCRCRSTVARKNSLERLKPRKKPREEPAYEGWPVLFWQQIMSSIWQEDIPGGCTGWRLWLCPVFGKKNLIKKVTQENDITITRLYTGGTGTKSMCGGTGQSRSFVK